MRELLVQEIEQVSGGNYQGFSMPDGSGFSWTGPNGIEYHNVTFVGTHFFEMDGLREYFVDYFHVSSYPLPTIEGFLAANSWLFPQLTRTTRPW
jgi:hypothetical protein